MSTRGRTAQQNPRPGRAILRLENLEPRELLAGELDFTFNGTGKVNVDTGLTEEASAVGLQQDGKIVMTGLHYRADGDGDFGVTRMRADGELDTGFGVNGHVIIPFDLSGTTGVDVARSIKVQRDGRIIVGGFAMTDGFEAYIALVRLTSNGTLDPTFGTGGKVVVSFNSGGFQDDKSYSIALQRDGKIVVSGSTLNVNQDHDFGAIRLNSDGTIDTGFGVNGRAIIPFDLTTYKDDNCFGVAIQRDGRIVLVGTARLSPDDVNIGVVRLLANGNPDPSFGVGGQTNVGFDPAGQETADNGGGIVIRTDGKIIVSGSTRPAGSNNADVSVVRFNIDGTLDSGFGGDGKVSFPFDIGGGLSDRMPALLLQPDAKVVVAGVVEIDTGKYAFGAARLSPAGNLDQSFSGDGKTTISIDIDNGIDFDFGTSAALQPDGRIVVAGFAWRDNQANLSDYAAIRLLGDERSSPFDGFRPIAEQRANPVQKQFTNQSDASMSGVASNPQSSVAAPMSQTLMPRKLRNLSSFTPIMLRPWLEAVHFVSA